MTGLLNSDPASVVTGVSLSTTTGAAATAGTHTITASGGTAANYAITDVNGTLTVSQAALTVTADDQTKVYGAADPTLTYTPSGTLYYGDAYSVITGVSLSTTTGAAATAGTHTITASGGTAANYAITDVNGTLTVSQAALTVTADDQTKVYGAADPTLTYTPSGTLYYGDAYSVITGVSLSTTTGAAATAGTHTITASGGTAANYAITDVNGTLTVSQAALTVTADDQTKVYGAADPTLTYTPSGTLYYGDAYSVITGVSLSTTTGAAATAGTHTITASGGAAANYAITDVNGTLTVSQAALTVTADNQIKVYGAADPTLTYTSSGTALLRRRLPSLITGVRWPPRPRASSHGRAVPTPSPPAARVDADYAISYVAGTLTVTPAALTITADNQTKVYGAALPTLTGQLHRLRQRRHLGQPDHPAHADHDGHRQQPCRGQPLHHHRQRRASMPTTPSPYVAGTLTVTPAALTITADNQTKVYGAALPTLTASYTGFVNGDTSASLTTQPTLTHDGHRQQPCRGQPLHHHRQRRGRFRLHDQLRRRHPDRHPGGVDDHGRQPDQGLRRGVADPDGQLLGLRQWRHLGQPDHPAHADHDGHRQQPCRGQPLHHHRQRRGRYRLHDHATSPAP